MTIGSLFSGIGGFEYAAHQLGYTTAFCCEKDPFCQKVLKYHYPSAQIYEDIKTTDFTIWRGRIDILTGGFPCQPFSNAGQRKGTNDDRYLWPEMLRAIREIQPSFIIGENVAGIVNMGITPDYITLESNEFASQEEDLVLQRIWQDLETEGYAVQPFIIPACSVGAPHKRDRIWIIAENTHSRTDGDNEASRQDRQHGNTSTTGEVCATPTPDPDKQHGNISGFCAGGISFEQTTGIQQDIITDTSSLGCNDGRNNREERHIQSDKRLSQEIQQEREEWDTGSSTLGYATANASKQGLQRSEGNGDARGKRKERDKFTAGLLRSVWHEFPTQSPLCSRNDGFPYRLSGITFSTWREEALKGLGNAIVPQVALRLFLAIEGYAAHNHLHD